MELLDKLTKYFWFTFGVIGVILFWAGIWEGIGGLPYLVNPFISLAVGMGMLLISEFFFKENNPLWGERRDSAPAVLRTIHKNPKKHEFHIKYLDKLKNHEVLIGAGKLKAIEKEFLVILDHGGKELFIPIHRVTEVLHKGKTHWKA